MWKDLSLKEKAAFMQVAVNNGIYDLKDIQEHYNKFAEGGSTNSYSAGSLVDDIYKNFKREEYLGKPSHNYDFTISEEEANRLGYYPDERGHRDDRVKKPAHPTHPSRGKWNSFEEFELTDKGMENPNYTLFGLNDGEQDPQAVMTYRGGVVLPEITVTPKKNYIYNPYDNINIYAEGGYVREKNNNPVAFDEEGNLVDQITGEKGTMMLPNFNVYGSKEVADRVAQRRLDNLINHSEINPFTGEKRVIGLERTYPEFELLGFKDLAGPIFSSIKKGVTYSAAKLGSRQAQSKIIADMLDNSTLNNTLLTPISSRQITYTPNTPAPSSTFTGFNDMRAYSEFVNRLDRDYAKAYLEGDIETGQRMWDNWFKYRTPNNKAIDAQGNPIKTYHTVGDQYDPSFTIFNTGIEGRPTAIYSTDNPIMSASYSHKPVDETVLNSNLDHIKSIYKARTKLRKRDFKTDYLKAKESNFQDTFFTDRIDKKQYINDLQKIKQEEAIALNNMRKSYSPERRKELYLNLENPLEIEGYGKSWKDIPVILGEGLENLSLSKNIPKMREFANKYGIYFDDPNDILYLDRYALEDEFLEKLGAKLNVDVDDGMYSLSIDNFDEYPVEIQNTIRDFERDLNKHIYSKSRVSTRNIEDLIRHQDGTNFDSAIIRDIGDWGGNAKPKLMFNEETGGYNTGTVFESFKPSQLKSAAPFTFDDNGKLIPLSKRANFNNPDMRYSLLPIGLTIGGATYLNQRNKNK